MTARLLTNPPVNEPNAAVRREMDDIRDALFEWVVERLAESGGGDNLVARRLLARWRHLRGKLAGGFTQ